MPIRVLPPLLVNQIAAGEVVERPANVVKELVENALDADATRIEIETDAGGKELIRVTDDGCGIAAEELPLAIASHATSKIASVEDLGCIRSMGFRGEALASIASVSRLRLLSRPGDAVAAAVLEGEGDRFEAVRPASGPPGTTIHVRNLFFNTPARRRFLKGDSAEAGRVADVVTAAALACADVAFRLIQGGRVALDLPAGQSRRERVATVLGDSLAAELLEVGEPAPAPSDGAWLRVWGMAGRPASARPGAKQIRLYVNGRPVVDRLLTHAVREAYRGLIDPSRSPTAVLFLEVDPHEVDVNVHPTKAEVRFRSGGVVHQVVQRAVRSALRAADLVPEISLAPPWSGAAETMPPGGGTVGGPSGGGEALQSWPRTPASGFGGSFAAWTRPGEAAPGWASMLPRAATAPPAAVDGPAEAAVTSVLRAAPTTAVSVLQAHRKYVVLEDPEGILVVDQHALHERVMFERFLARLGEGSLESQRLLVPVALDADRTRLESLDELSELLQRLGFDAAAGGPGTILIHAVPTLLHSRGADAAEFLAELLDRAGTGELAPNREAALVDVLSMMACKAAIKAGDSLTPQELSELLAQRHAVERSTACPHGRPTSLRITIAELDRWFGRT